MDKKYSNGNISNTTSSVEIGKSCRTRYSSTPVGSCTEVPTSGTEIFLQTTNKRQ